MNIAFDSIGILGPDSRNRGIGNHMQTQFAGVINEDKNNCYYFLNMIDSNYHLKDHCENSPSNLVEDYIYTGENQFLLRDQKYQDIIGAIIQNYIKENKIDLFYITSPFDYNYYSYKREWFDGVNTIATVYDLIPYVFKEKYLSDQRQYNWYRSVVDNLRWVDKILVATESIKADLMEYFNFPAEQIAVVGAPVNPMYKKISITNIEKHQLFNKYHITRKYILCVGADDERKNLDGLIRAYSLLPPVIKQEYEIVIVCKLSDWMMKKLIQEAISHHVDNDIIFTNFVDDDELIKLYNLATLIAFPSKYEGFGLPIVEGWACGKPVLTANNSSLIEISNNATILVDAENDYSIAKGMEKILSDTRLQQEYINRGKERLSLFTPNTIAIRLLNEINQLELVKTQIQTSTKTRLAIFIPSINEINYISQYYQQLITNLQPYFKIDIFTKGDISFINDQLRQEISVYQDYEYHNLHCKYAHTLYIVANSGCCIFSYHYIRLYGGIIDLLDYNLHASFYQFSTIDGKLDISFYKQIISDDYDIDVTKEQLPHQNLYELNGYLTKYVKKIIVHHYQDKQKILAKSFNYKVLLINDNHNIKSTYQKFILAQDDNNINQELLDLVISDENSSRSDYKLLAETLAYAKKLH